MTFRFDSLKLMGKLKKRKAKSDQQKRVSSAIQSTAPQVRPSWQATASINTISHITPDAPEPAFDNEWTTENSDLVPDDSGATNSAILRKAAELRTEGNKKNQPQPSSSRISKGKSFIDPQPNAQRVSFDDGPSQDQHTSNPDPDHGIQGDDDQVSDLPSDIGDQRDKPNHRRTTNAKRRREGEETAKQHKAKMARPSRNHPVGLRNIDAINGGHEVPMNGTPTATPVEIFKAMTDKARAATQKGASLRPPQTRTGWSDEETSLLCSLIEQHGTSWSLIKSKDVDGCLRNRNQVALKDKARNMKMVYLK